MLKDKKILFLILFCFVFLLFASSNTFASTQCDVSNLTEQEKETLITFMEYAKTDIANKGLNIDDLWYFVIYSNDYTKGGTTSALTSKIGFDIYVVDPSKNTTRILNASKGVRQNQFNYLWGATCFVGLTPECWWGAITSSTSINSKYGFGSSDSIQVISNNITATGCDFTTDTFSNVLYNLKNPIIDEPDTPTVTPQERGTLAPMAQEMKLEMVVQEILKILPLIIVVVVSFLGLRKGLKLLLTLLRQA